MSRKKKVSLTAETLVKIREFVSEKGKDYGEGYPIWKTSALVVGCLGICCSGVGLKDSKIVFGDFRDNGMFEIRRTEDDIDPSRHAESVMELLSDMKSGSSLR